MQEKLVYKQNVRLQNKRCVHIASKMNKYMYTHCVND